MNFKINNCYLLDSFVIGGKLEGQGPIGDYIDYIHDIDTKCYEDNEILSLLSAIDHLLEKNNLKIDDIDLAISGELSNQLATTSYSYRRILLPLIGVYSACSTIALEIGLAGLLLGSNNIKNILISTSSNTEAAEREFRNPNEYGGEKLPTQTFTSTISASAILTSTKQKIKVSSFTLGKVIDVGYTNSFDFGRAMAPAAIDTLLNHFRSTNTLPSDYDLILTGDLSSFGYEITLKALKEEYGEINNYKDCGLILYNVDKQKVFAGGSGPGTSAAVLLSYIKKEMLNNTIRKVLLCATGALMNPTMVAQKNSIPSIAHIIVLEVEKWYIYKHF